MENSNTLARALVYARTGDQTYRAKVIQQVLGCMSTATGHTLALGRQLGAYVIAADLVGLEPDENRDFRIFLRAVQVKTMSDGESLISRTLGKANNWNVCGFSWACCARYLGDTEGLEENSRVLRGWLGDFAAYRYPADAWGELWWQADPQNPVGVNPPDTFIQGHPGVVCWAEVLFRADYPAWEWGDKAFLRAFQWLHDPEVFNPPFTVADSGGDDIWMAWVINKRYGTSFPAPVETKPGRNVAHTSWTHE